MIYVLIKNLLVEATVRKTRTVQIEGSNWLLSMSLSSFRRSSLAGKLFLVLCTAIITKKV